MRVKLERGETISVDTPDGVVHIYTRLHGFAEPLHGTEKDITHIEAIPKGYGERGSDGYAFVAASPRAATGRIVELHPGRGTHDGGRST